MKLPKWLNYIFLILSVILLIILVYDCFTGNGSNPLLGVVTCILFIITLVANIIDKERT